MASGSWLNLGRRSKPPTAPEFLRLSKTNIEGINDLISPKPHTKEPLNLYQCRSMSSKLLTTVKNIERCPAYIWDGVKLTPTFVELSTRALENFYLVSERAKKLVESCCNADWCRAATFQIQNEEAFKEILLETSLCYNSIFELVKDKGPYQNLRRTPTFEPPTSEEVMQDRMALLQRLQNFVRTTHTADSCIRKQHLAKHLLGRLSSSTSQSKVEDFDVCHLSLLADGKSPGDEWGNSDFLSGNVLKTTWLDVPCAKKVFELGGQESEKLAVKRIVDEARTLAGLNHPNIIKFICCGYAEDTSCAYIAMESMEKGLHLVIKKQAKLKEGPPFPLLSSLDIMLQIAYGTCYLHDNRIAHRDLKTCNVVVSQITTPHLKDYLQVKVVDFGLSKVNLSASKSTTISYPKIGTTGYRAPEAFKDGRVNWFKADAYSFGIMCAVILSGKEPFQHIEKCKVQEEICNGRRPSLPPDTREELARLINKCWDTDRNRRPDFVEICTKLAKLRHKVLREADHGHGIKDDMDDLASPYIQDMIKKHSEARKQECKQNSGNPIATGSMNRLSVLSTSRARESIKPREKEAGASDHTSRARESIKSREKEAGASDHTSRARESIKPQEKEAGASDHTSRARESIKPREKEAGASDHTSCARESIKPREKEAGASDHTSRARESIKSREKEAGASDHTSRARESIKPQEKEAGASDHTSRARESIKPWEKEAGASDHTSRARESIKPREKEAGASDHTSCARESIKPWEKEAGASDHTSCARESIKPWEKEAGASDHTSCARESIKPREKEAGASDHTSCARESIKSREKEAGASDHTSRARESIKPR